MARSTLLLGPDDPAWQEAFLSLTYNSMGLLRPLPADRRAVRAWLFTRGMVDYAAFDSRLEQYAQAMLAISISGAASKRAWALFADINKRVASIAAASMCDEKFDVRAAIFPATQAAGAARFAALAAAAEADCTEIMAARSWRFVLLGDPVLRVGQQKRRRGW